MQIFVLMTIPQYESESILTVCTSRTEAIEAVAANAVQWQADAGYGEKIFLDVWESGALEPLSRELLKTYENPYPGVSR